jgi:hypothetical protein
MYRSSSRAMTIGARPSFDPMYSAMRENNPRCACRMWFSRVQKTIAVQTDRTGLLETTALPQRWYS